MVETFISRAGAGKSGCMLIEAAKQKGKDVAFISLEMTEKEILRRLECIGTTTKSFRIITPKAECKSLNAWLLKILPLLAEDYDIICIDAIDVASVKYGLAKKADFEKINDACFKTFMTQCESLWVTHGVYRKMEFDEDYISNPEAVASFEIPGIVRVKQVCRRIEHPLLPGMYSIEAVDLVAKEVKTYNFSKLFKNKK